MAKCKRENQQELLREGAETENQGSDSESEKKPEKKRQVKYVYYDDGSTVADMSGTRKNKEPPVKSTWREKARTFFTVMKKMVVPMLCTLAAFTILYIIIQAIASTRA